MPAEYEAMRDKFARTMGYDAAQSKAAAIYTSRHPDDPASGWADTKRAAKKTRRKRWRKGRRKLGWAATAGTTPATLHDRG